MHSVSHVLQVEEPLDFSSFTENRSVQNPFSAQQLTVYCHCMMLICKSEGPFLHTKAPSPRPVIQVKQ